ncbi:LysR family transcriptional regulator [Thalassospira sp. SM2505]
MNFSQIQTFIEVADAGSFAAAARRLSVPRSTVTARVAALEEHLAVRLLHRTTRQVSLTDDGQRYLDHCRAAVALLQEGEADLSQYAVPSGQIRISVPVDYPKMLLAEQITSFRANYPDVRFVVNVSDQTVDLVGENYDIALRGRHPGRDGLIARRLRFEPMGLFARPGTFPDDMWSKGTTPTLPILDHANVLQSVSDPGLELSEPPIRTGNFELARSLAAKGALAAILPISGCADDVAKGKLVQITCPVELEALALYIVMPSRRQLPKRVRLFIDHLVDQFK